MNPRSNVDRAKPRSSLDRAKPRSSDGIHEFIGIGNFSCEASMFSIAMYFFASCRNWLHSYCAIPPDAQKVCWLSYNTHSGARSKGARAVKCTLRPSQNLNPRSVSFFSAASLVETNIQMYVYNYIPVLNYSHVGTILDSHLFSEILLENHTVALSRFMTQSARGFARAR